MLGDLQHKLSELGRTDVLQAVGEKALAHCGDDGLDDKDAEALARRARALRVVGTSALERMDKTQARCAFEQAADTTARLLALAPNNIQRLQDDASSLQCMVKLVDRDLDAGPALALCWQISALRWRASERAPQDDALRLQALTSDQWPAALGGSVADHSPAPPRDGRSAVAAGAGRRCAEHFFAALVARVWPAWAWRNASQALSPAALPAPPAGGG